MQKLLIHINFLLAFSVLFCSHSAYGQSVYIDESSSPKYGADRRAVDLGLNVYWAKYNVGVTNNDSTDYGDYFTWKGAKTWNSSHNYLGWVGYWRTPTKQEFNDLYTNTNRSINNFICTFVNKNDNSKSIILPPAGGIEPYFGSFEFKGTKGYYWTSDSHSDTYGLRFTFDCCSWYLSEKWRKTYQLSIRPVIDKDTITVTTAGGNTITKTYPRGTKIKIGAFMDECHKVAYWTKSSISESGTITPNNTSGDNGDIEIIITEDVTYTAYFSIKTTNIRATTDSSKGWVGLNVWK